MTSFQLNVFVLKRFAVLDETRPSETSSHFLISYTKVTLTDPYAELFDVK